MISNITPGADDWTDEQKAIIYPVKWGNSLVTACAGSGKSTTIVQRAIEQTKIIFPWKSIALISFTKKSVEDLKRKLLKNQSSQIYITTFHAFLIGEILCFNDLFRGKQYAFQYSKKVTSIDTWLTTIATEEVIPVADTAKKDFLFEYALSMLDEKIVIDYLTAKYQAIYIDEAQDNNGLQYDIVNKLVELGIECVLIGDPNQTIFGFRGAEPEKFEALEQNVNFTGNIFRLTKNFRCHPIIDKWANSYTMPQVSETVQCKNTSFGIFIFSGGAEKLIGKETILNEGVAILLRTNGQLSNHLICPRFDGHLLT